MRFSKEKDPLAPGKTAAEGKGGYLPLFGFLAAILTLFSFFLWEGEGGTGDVSRAVSYFEEFFDENEAIAVFLGWEGA